MLRTEPGVERLGRGESIEADLRARLDALGRADGIALGLAILGEVSACDLVFADDGGAPPRLHLLVCHEPVAQRAASKCDAAMLVERAEPFGQRLAAGTLAGGFADRVVGFAHDSHCGQGSCAHSLQGSSERTSPMMVNCSV